MVTITECPSCGSKDLSKKIACKDYTVSAETFTIVECVKCTTRITSPRPDNISLPQYYLSDDYISHTSSAKSLFDKIYLLARKYTIKKKIALINRLNESTKNILDYGCGTGEFLHACQLNGWTIDGVEPSQIAREKANHLLSTTVASSIEETNQLYSIATLWHVLEHVPNPSQTLMDISQKLLPNGTIIIAVPNYTSYDARHYYNYWAAYDVPRHLWHFSPKGMRTIIEKSGLELTNPKPMILDSFYVSFLSEKYKNGRLTLVGAISAFFIGLLSNLSALKTKNYSSLIYVVKKK